MHPTSPTNAPTVTLMVFTRAHALWMLAATAAALAVAPWLAAVAGALSLGACIALHRGRWTPSGAFGAANALTLLRLLMIAILAAPALTPPGPAAALLVLAVFTLDGVDGWLARRRGETSIFGAYFDLECDALLVLVCALVLHQHGRLPAFVLLAGLLRYLYVLVLLLVPALGGEARPSRLGRHVFSLVVVSLIASLWPLEPLHRPLALISTLALVVSFGRSLQFALRSE
jgi:phosphatidylglycerophosphate synthase